MTLKIQHLETFIQIATHQGFNRAAAHLNIAQSALSRQINLLEDELGVSLFVRNERGVQLTPAGDVLRQRAEAILRQIRQTRDELMAQAEQPRGEVSIGLPASLEDIVGVPLLTRFSQTYPNVAITGRTGVSIELREWVLSGKVDLAIYGVLEPETVLAARPLFRDQVVIAGPPEWAAAGSGAMGVHDLVGMPLILTPHPNSLRLLVDNAADRAQVKLNVTMQLQSAQLALALLNKGQGYSVLPSTIVRRPVALGLISARPLRYFSYKWIVAHSRERMLSTASTRLLEMIEEIAMTEPIASLNLDAA